MMMRRFGKRLALAAALAMAFAAPVALAQQAEPAPKPGKPIRSGAMTVYASASCKATASQWREELTIPWIRTTGGPLPAIR